jgi:hypothetical protein
LPILIGDDLSAYLNDLKRRKDKYDRSDYQTIRQSWFSSLDWVDTATAAEMCGVSLSAIQQRIKMGDSRLPFIQSRERGSVYVSRDCLGIIYPHRIDFLYPAQLAIKEETDNE